MLDPRLTRRETLRLGLGAMGLSLPSILSLRATAHAAATGKHPANNGFGRAKSCIILFAWGGIRHIDTFDPKPGAPAEFRGIFQPISTSVPGIRFSEHLPHLARQAHRLAVVRSAHHRSSAHGKGMYWNLTGHPPQQPDFAANNEATGQDWPCLGSVVSKVRHHPHRCAGLCHAPLSNVGQHDAQGGHDAGWFGRTYDPIILKPAARQSLRRHFPRHRHRFATASTRHRSRGTMAGNRSCIRWNRQWSEHHTTSSTFADWPTNCF